MRHLTLKFDSLILILWEISSKIRLKTLKILVNEKFQVTNVVMVFLVKNHQVPLAMLMKNRTLCGVAKII
jgi:hypothetical protein